MNAKKIQEMLSEVNDDVLLEKANPELEKTKEDVQRIQDQLSKLKVTIHKEKEAGKSQSLLDGLKKQWQSLQDKIAQIWKSYDNKFGTKYHLAYESLSLEEDKLKGGEGDNKPDSDFDPEQLKVGTKVELEHTDDPEIAKEIAKDQLSEDPEYYKKIARDVPDVKAAEDAVTGKSDKVQPEQNSENKTMKLALKYEKGAFSYLYWPCMTNLTEKRLHITAKFFGEVPLTVEEIKAVLLGIEGVDDPINVKELEWEPVVFSTHNDGAVAVLELKKYPPVLDQIHTAFNKFRKDDYQGYKPHITVSEEIWTKVAEEKITPVQAGLEVLPLELSIKGLVRYKWGPEGGYVEEIDGKDVHTNNPTYGESMAAKTLKSLKALRG